MVELEPAVKQALAIAVVHKRKRDSVLREATKRCQQLQDQLAECSAPSLHQCLQNIGNPSSCCQRDNNVCHHVPLSLWHHAFGTTPEAFSHVLTEALRFHNSPLTVLTDTPISAVSALIQRFFQEDKTNFKEDNVEEEEVDAGSPLEVVIGTIAILAARRAPELTEMEEDCLNSLISVLLHARACHVALDKIADRLLQLLLRAPITSILILLTSAALFDGCIMNFADRVLEKTSLTHEEGCEYSLEQVQTLTVTAEDFLVSGLEALPKWKNAIGSFDTYLTLISNTILETHSHAQILALSHPEVLKQVHRVSAQLMKTLQLISMAL